MARKMQITALIFVVWIVSCAKKENPVSIGTVPGIPALSYPVNCATEIYMVPSFGWHSSEGATNYTLQLSTDSSFINHLWQFSRFDTHQTVELDTPSTYYWRVRADNSNGSSNWSPPYSFTTVSHKVHDLGSSLIPGALRCLLALGSYAYVYAMPDAFTDNLTIVNISDPTQPQVVSQISFLDEVKDVDIQGNYCFVACYYSGLRILDVSNITSPVEVGFYKASNGDARGIDVDGSYAYVANNVNLLIINISDPKNPFKCGQWDYSNGYVNDVVIQGGYAYVSTGMDGILHIIDISNPALPAEAGWVDTPVTAAGIAVSGNYAYVAGCGGGLRIIDVSNPIQPREVGYADCWGSWTSDVAISGKFAFAATGGADLMIYDISQPVQPVIADAYTTTSSPNRLAVDGNVAYFVTSERFRCVDVTGFGK